MDEVKKDGGTLHHIGDNEVSPEFEEETAVIQAQMLEAIADADGAFVVVLKDGEVLGGAFGPHELAFAVADTARAYFASLGEAGVIEYKDPEEVDQS